ncbi:MAG: Ig-like domain-containing protein [Steroidobacteraceae bacterium]
MADYAIGLSFHKAHRTLVRAVDLTPPCRYFATRDSAGMITLPTLDAGSRYVELQGVSNTTFAINDNNQEFRLLGDNGWSDSLITGSSVQASVTAYFLKDTAIPAGQNCPVFRGNYEEGFALIEKARYNKDYEIYVEFLKELGQANGTSGNFIYDFTGFNAVVMNYNENLTAEGLTEVSFDLMSRGRPVFGRYDAGSTALAFGGVQSSLLFTAADSGDRRYAVSPLADADSVAVGSNVTVTYTSDGTTALQQLSLGQTDGGGFRLEVASTGVAVPATVALGGAGTNVVTINPNADLAAGTIYRLRVADGAIKQALDGSGSPSASGVLFPLQGFESLFKTA